MVGIVTMIGRGDSEIESLVCYITHLMLIR